MTASLKNEGGYFFCFYNNFNFEHYKVNDSKHL